MQKTSGFFTRDITDIRLTDVEGIGIIRWVGNKRYRWILNSTTTTLTVGGNYTFGAVSTGGFFTEIYTFGQSSKETTINGPIVTAVSAIPSAQYGWVQEGGEVAAQIGGAAGSNVAQFGNLLGVSGQIYLTLDTATGTAPKSSFGAVALAAGNSNATNVNILLKPAN
jgi:hypothetical protein